MTYNFQLIGGFGNLVQMYPSWEYIKDNLDGTLDVSYVMTREEDYPGKAAFWDVIADYHGIRLNYAQGEKPAWWDDYSGVFIVSQSAAYPHRNIMCQNTTKGRNSISEVAWYARVAGMPVKNVRLDWAEISGRDPDTGYDVLICNGGLNTPTWQRKKYQRWPEVIAMLRKAKVRVACVGLPEEYVYPAEDLTHLDIHDTMHAISGCRVFASNDTGLYHFASIIGVPCVVVFTATSTLKNHDKEFHKTARPVTSGCSCQTGWILGSKWNQCRDWKCTRFDPQGIVNEILSLL